MRVYGRLPPDVNGYRQWVEVQTDANGYNDGVYITALAQCILLELGESPFFANYGIPGVQSVLSQIAPDLYVSIMQQRYAGFFASLIITRQPQQGTFSRERPVPTYNIKLLTHRGSVIDMTIPT